MNWTETATREELANYCRHAEEHQRAQAAELDRLRAERDALAYQLRVYVHAHRSGNAVPPYIEQQAMNLLTPNAELTGAKRLVE